MIDPVHFTSDFLGKCDNRYFTFSPIADNLARISAELEALGIDPIADGTHHTDYPKLQNVMNSGMPRSLTCDTVMRLMAWESVDNLAKWLSCTH